MNYKEGFYLENYLIPNINDLINILYKNVFEILAYADDIAILYEKKINY